MLRTLVFVCWRHCMHVCMHFYLLGLVKMVKLVDVAVERSTVAKAPAEAAAFKPLSIFIIRYAHDCV